MAGMQQNLSTAHALLDKFLPGRDYEACQKVLVAAPPARVMQALKAFSPHDDLFLRALLRLRDIPSKRRHGAATFGLSELGALHRHAMHSDASELILGFTGQVWDPRAALQSVTAPQFLDYHDRGSAKVVWHFGVQQRGLSRTALYTTMAAQTFGHDSMDAFSRYWSLVKAPSSALRLYMIWRIGRQARIFQ